MELLVSNFMEFRKFWLPKTASFWHRANAFRYSHRPAEVRAENAPIDGATLRGMVGALCAGQTDAAAPAAPEG